MRFVSTRGRAPAADLETALFQGLAPDGGLFVPAGFEPLPSDDSSDAAVMAALVGEDIPRAALGALLSDALTFDIPLRRVTDRISVLELFHGPTFAFKDVGARVMARLMAYFMTGRDPLTVLVATSGDTGSAVAQAFYAVANTRVVVLFPAGQVTPIQEAQFTTLGGNITAVAVNGTFDDCQRLAKEALSDADLRARARLTSANSINIGRLIPQAIYYVRAARAKPSAVVVVQSGNAGNLTAGVIAQRLGAPIARFVAATTVNDTLPRYLATGRYEPRPSVPTLANAMDVGNPSNVERLRWLFEDDVTSMRRVIDASVHTDADVREAIAELWRDYGYIADPHTAIGYLGTRRVSSDEPAIFLATAHPAKFREVVEPIIGERVSLPRALEEALAKPRVVERIDANFSALRRLL